MIWLARYWKPVAVLVLLGAVWLLGDRAGRRSVLADWNAEKLATAQAEADQRREDAAMARKASTQHQADVAAIRERDAALRGKLHDALNQPLPACPATLDGVRIPADALRVLHDAAADPAP